MRVRHLIREDVKRIQELRGEDFDWELGPDTETVLVLVDEQDIPRGFAGAWKRAETHLLLDPKWETPAIRLAAVHALHYEMDARLANKGYRRAVMWCDDMRAWARRLLSLGWRSSKQQSWHRRLG